jgi:ribokinase
MNRKYDVVTALDACVDLMIQGDVVPRFGQTEQLVDNYMIEMGGSACIFACQCAKLGLTTAGTGVVGNDMFGELVLKRLNEAGVDITRITVQNGIQTGIGLALCKQDGDRAILTVPGSIDATNPQPLIALLPQARHLHIASYYLLKELRPHWPAILREAKRIGLTTSIDTNYDPLERWDGIGELLPYLDIFFPNSRELLAFTGMNDIEAAALKLSAEGPLVAVKLGADGAAACRHGHGMVYCPAIQVFAGDTVGAGDTFDGGFLYGYLNRLPLEDCLMFGVYCAGKSVQARGGIEGQPCIGEARPAVKQLMSAVEFISH